MGAPEQKIVEFPRSEPLQSVNVKLTTGQKVMIGGALGGIGVNLAMTTWNNKILRDIRADGREMMSIIKKYSSYLPDEEKEEKPKKK